MDVEPAFVSDGEPAEPVEPGEGALDDPSVPTEFLAAFDASSALRGLIRRQWQAPRQRR